MKRGVIFRIGLLFIPLMLLIITSVHVQGEVKRPERGRLFFCSGTSQVTRATLKKKDVPNFDLVNLSIVRKPVEEETVQEAVEEVIEEDIPDVQYEYIGTWTTTAYCPCELCCGEWATGCTASGVPATANHTVACNSLSFGTKLLIDGIIYTVEDTGWTPYGEAWIDIFFDSHEEAEAYGMREREVYIVT